MAAFGPIVGGQSMPECLSLVVHPEVFTIRAHRQRTWSPINNFDGMWHEIPFALEFALRFSPCDSWLRQRLLAQPIQIGVELYALS